MSGLFGTVATKQGNTRVHQKDNLIHLPSTQAHGPKLLVEELISWSPMVKAKHRRQDTVMALWFAELRAREIVSTVRNRSSFMKNPFLSERDKSKQMTVNLDQYFQESKVDTWI
jgi:hypothetical protein